MATVKAWFVLARGFTDILDHPLKVDYNMPFAAA